MKTVALIFCLFFTLPALSAVVTSSCQSALAELTQADPPADLEKELTQSLTPCSEKVCTGPEFASRYYAGLRTHFERAKSWTRQKKGYLIIIATMVASSALNSEMVGVLPHQMLFLSQMLSQFTTLGIYVFGAPILEPISSWFRKVAFGVGNLGGGDVPAEDRRLESIWFNTQKNYSLNSQMSRNTINNFITSTKQNFYEAYRAMNGGSESYAAAQIAEVAVRLSTLFKDIPPDEPSLTTAVQLAFTQHVVITDAFKKQVWDFICLRDSQCRESQSQSRYQRAISAWLP